MKTGLYYFSATGNSLTSAKILKEQLNGDCEIISIPSLKKQPEVAVKYQRVGFVFPIYYGDMPNLVRQVISKMTFEKGAYIFLVATYRGHPGDIAKRLDDLLRQRNASLSLNLGLSMPGNSYLSTEEQMKETLANQVSNLKIIAQKIDQGIKEDYSSLPEVAPSAVFKASNMRGIKADENCIGCGICARVCPMDNIKIVDKKAVIGDNCITCLACFHWCPQEAIYMSKEKDIERRFKYHHPDVTLKDIIDAKKSK
ncbi:EFR1 family ferrodoxin [uncultured Thomasclavelia sp.]|uniref:EFR1 family ferrodoxin n=1 Tax=uncultured Thomasclavelia sp. TaxID=3025759 RepID=UPI0025F55939|nr:EFR1 family ferrodoxin [uncultured Thomasclavelia sp.]